MEFGEDERTQITRCFGSMSLFSSMADITAEPNLPVALVRASILSRVN